ncbi:MAG: hypothetical protein GC179_06610 [Anaerolineaceae bacterium]|nr:hypothetical protein [Anaerolineaceae bacterium]
MMGRSIILPGSAVAPYARHFYILLGATLIIFVGMLLLVSSFFLLLGFSIAWYHIPLAAVPTMLFVWWGAGQFFPQTQRRMFLITSAWAASAFIVLTLLNGLVYDTSWDGQNYHFEAILQMINGWNPFYGNPTNAVYFQHLEHFTKGPWLNAVAIYKLTGQIEQAKAFHMLLMLAAYLLCAAAFSTFRTLNHRRVVLLSLLVVFNPVSIYQLFTFYVDGLMSSILVIVVSLFILMYRQPSRVLMVTLASAIVIMVNIKLTGAIYAAILGAIYSLWFIWHKKQYRVGFVACLFAGYSAGVLLVGYNPYITQYIGQFLSKGDPFYPSNLKTFIPLEDNIPSNFSTMSWGEKLLTSLFSKSQATTKPSQYKLPFTVSLDEILTFYAPDARVAGFGPLFSAALLTIVLLIIALARYRRRLRFASVLLLLMGGILVSGLSNPEAWWARFVPQLWMLPLFTILLIMVATPRGKLYRLSRIILIILCINQVLIASPYLISAVARSILETQQMIHLKNSGERISITFNHFVSIESRFKEWGIEYQSVDELPCAVSQQQSIVGTEARICSPSG